MRDPIAVVYRASEKAKTYKMLVLKNHLVDDILSNTKKKPILPYKNYIDIIGVGSGFVEIYKEKYNIKTHKELE